MNDNETACCDLVANVKATVRPLDNRQVGGSRTHSYLRLWRAGSHFLKGTLLRSGFVPHGEGGDRGERGRRFSAWREE